MMFLLLKVVVCVSELLSYGYINNKEEGGNKHEDNNGEDSDYEESE